jgi:DNA-binding transcriptional ArsR family regulator
MTKSNLQDEQLARATTMLKAIAHPARIQILEILKSGEELTVSQIQQMLKTEQPSTSHHLSLLKDKGVVCASRRGRNIFYRIKHKVLGEIIDCMQKCTC